MDTSSNIFNMDQKFDLAALLKSAASNMVAASNGSTPTHNNNTIPSSPGPDSASPTLSGSSPTNAQQAQQLLNTNLINPITQITLNNHSPFVPIRPVYAPSGYGRQILIYDSRSVS
uniref:Uncharacterized protein n=1 Tax=Ditylenchus dipsaci TaxID=166011 RepID=A0A915D7J1_9BILA